MVMRLLCWMWFQYTLARESICTLSCSSSERFVKALWSSLCPFTLLGIMVIGSVFVICLMLCMRSHSSADVSHSHAISKHLSKAVSLSHAMVIEPEVRVW